MKHNGRYSSNVYFKSFEVVRKISDDIFELKKALFESFTNPEPVVARAEIIDNKTGQVIHNYSRDEFY